jgi:O-antigen/teichoic acid export membrane protein
MRRPVSSDSIGAGPGADSPSGEGYDAYVGRIARGAGMSSFGQGIGRLLGYAMQVMLARMYGPAQLGFYALGMTLVQIVNILSQLGMDNGVVRYVAHYAGEGDTARVRGTIIQALAVTFAFSVALSVMMFAGAGFIAENLFGKPFLGTMFRAFSLSVPFFALMSMALWATQGFQTVKYATWVQQVLRPSINLVLIVVFYLIGTRILGAVAAYALSMAAGSVLALYYLRRVFPKLTDRSVPAKFESRALFRVSGPMIVAGFANRANAWIAVGVLGVFSATDAVGIYNAAMRTAAMSGLVLLAFNGIFSPMISSLHNRNLLADLGYLYKDVSRWAFAGALAVFLLTALLARDIMAIFGEKFVPGWPVLVVIAAAQLFSSSVGPADRMLAMTGHHRVVMLATLASVSLSLIGCVALIPLYGILGAAAATAGGIALLNVVTLAGVRRRLGFWPYNPQYLRPALAGVLAAAATLLVKLALPIPAGLVAISILGPVLVSVFVAALLALGLTRSDRQLLGSFWAAVRRNLRRGE